MVQESFSQSKPTSFIFLRKGSMRFLHKVISMYYFSKKIQIWNTKHTNYCNEKHYKEVKHELNITLENVSWKSLAKSSKNVVGLNWINFFFLGKILVASPKTGSFSPRFFLDNINKIKNKVRETSPGKSFFF